MNVIVLHRMLAQQHIIQRINYRNKTTRILIANTLSQIRFDELLIYPFCPMLHAMCRRTKFLFWNLSVVFEFVSTMTKKHSTPQTKSSLNTFSPSRHPISRTRTHMSLQSTKTSIEKKLRTCGCCTREMIKVIKRFSNRSPNYRAHNITSR